MSYAPLNIYKVVVHLTEGCKPDVKACAALSRLKVFVWQATADCRGWWNSGTNHAKLMDWKLYLSKWQLIFVQNVNVFENCWSRGEPFKSQVVTMTRNLHQKVIEGHAQSGLLHLDFNLKASFMHTRHFSIFQKKIKQGNGKIYNPFSSSHHHQMVSKPTGWAVL